MTKPASILIVDDDGGNRRLLQALLGPEGYVTGAVASGEEALTRIAADPPDLILLDVMMPGLDGRQVARAVKAEPATSNIPIIEMPVWQRWKRGPKISCLSLLIALSCGCGCATCCT
jgi:CheY-like chemotaxis protein